MQHKMDAIYMKETQQIVGKFTNSTPMTQDEHTANRDFAPFATKMRADGLPELVINLFKHYYHQLASGETGYISGSVAGPVHTLPAYEELDERFESYGTAALEKAVIIKLNGGLGTSMGLQGPKSLLPVKNGLSFLDITVNQILHLRKRLGAQLPLVLMNSFSTDTASIQALARYPEFQQKIPSSFLQHRIPKIWKADLTPVAWSDDPEKEWCPPGHGDLYAAIDSSGMLDALIDAGFEYAFVSNSDNLGATLDLKILGYMAIHNVPFLMEVAQRTAADRKGGHLARRPDGQFILRESAQCPPTETDDFQNIERYRYFNTNNLWVNLRMLRKVINDRQGILGLPLIRNEKAVDPTQPTTPKVYQLETAMGSAIAVFDGAQALSVPRSRFLPVKKNSDLLGLWSDAYLLNEEYHLELAPERKGVTPIVILDDAHFGLIEEMKRRFPQGAPSLIRCNELRVEGDVIFGKNIVIEGKIHIIHRLSRPYFLENGMRLVGNQ